MSACNTIAGAAVNQVHIRRRRIRPRETPAPHPSHFRATRDADAGDVVPAMPGLVRVDKAPPTWALHWPPQKLLHKPNSRQTINANHIFKHVV